MSKNMTRKGLAFGAGFALIATGFAGAPATAAVDDNAVSLIPRTGTEYGGFIDNVFDLKTTTSLAAAGGSGNLKYLVEDPDKEVRFDFANDSPDAGSATFEITSSDLEGDELTIASAGTDSATATYRTTDISFIDGDAITVAAGTVVSSKAVSLVGTNNYDATSASTVTIAFDATDIPEIPSAGIHSITIDSLAGIGASGDLTELNKEHLASVVTLTGLGTATATVEITGLSVTNETDGDISAGNITVNLSDAAEELLEGNFEVSDDVKTAGAESFTYEFDDSSTQKFANGVYVVSTLDVDSGTYSTPISDKLDGYDVVVEGTIADSRVLTGLDAPTRDADGTFVIDTAVDVTGATTQFLRLASTSTDTHSVEVTAWIDENGNGEIDPTENSSSTRTVTFYKWADSGYELNIENPVAGEEWEVYASFNDDINASMITDQRLRVNLGVLDAGELKTAASGSNVNGSETAFSAPTSALDLNWDSSSHVEDFWGLKVTPDTSLDGSESVFVAGYTYAGQLWLGDSDASNFAALGNIVYTGTDGAVADDLDSIRATTNDNVLQSGANVKVREEYTGDVTFSLFLAEDDETLATRDRTPVGHKPVPEGTEVTVEVAEGSADLDSDSTVTADGSELTNGDDPIEFTVTTDANGFATFTLSNDEGVAGDHLDITMTHAGTSQTAAVKWIEPREANAFLSGATKVSTLAGEEWSINYTAIDEFGAPLTGGDYRVKATYKDEVGGSTKDTGVALDANGQGTLTVTDDSEGNGSYDVTATLQKLDNSADFQNYTHSVTTNVYIVSDTAAANLTVDAAGTDVDIELVPGTTTQTLTPNSGLAPNYSATEHYTITGVATNASGNAVRGGEVTLSGEGLIFNTGAHTSTTDSGIYTVGSLTVTTSATGAYSAEVRSNLAGEHVLTVSSGTASETETLEFEAAASTAGANVTLTAPANAEPGSTFSVTATVTDRFGNPVETGGADDFSLTYTGPGVALSIPTETNARGEATFAVLLGSNDTGSASIVVEYDADGSSTTTSDEYTVSRTVVVGSSVTQKVNAGSFKGFVAVYARGYEDQRLSAKIGNDWVIVDPIVNNQEDDTLFRVTDFTGAGVDIQVRIYIDRVLVDTIPLTTK